MPRKQVTQRVAELPRIVNTRAIVGPAIDVADLAIKRIQRRERRQAELRAVLNSPQTPENKAILLLHLGYPPKLVAGIMARVGLNLDLARLRAILEARREAPRLHDSPFSHAELAKYFGKRPQAVRQAIARGKFFMEVELESQRK